MASSVVKCKSCNIVICELLAFIQNKVDVMDEESLVRLCTSSFSAGDIEAAKNLLFDSITTTQRNVTRKRSGKSQRDLYDVISVFKQTDPEFVPIFVAKDLQKLPPVTFDHIDATRLLKDILILQNELRNIKNSYVTETQFKELQCEIKNLKQASIVNNFDFNVNRKRGGVYLLDSECLDSGHMGLPPISNKSPNSAPAAESFEFESSAPARIVSPSPSPSRERVKQQNPIIDATDRVQRSDSLVVTAGTEQVDTRRVSEMKDKQNEIELSTMSTQSASRSCAEVVKVNKTSCNKCDMPTQEDQWLLVQKKRLRNRFIGAKGKATTLPDVKFKAADLKIPLFVNKVHKETSEGDIIEYIKQKTNVSVLIKKINMKVEKHYDSYKIFVPENKLGLFLDDTTWPEGIQFRRFVYLNRSNYYSKSNYKKSDEVTQNDKTRHNQVV
ncbi:uncharacterized protein LOC123689520 [Pieris rapae]|uniref:uncharacterized protein LOC123689520 n=1 Tax=Pieris rapae TaxID=64459 RepID=UPI001E27C9A9|nr:uncharacterized protein LOC123689520 [Pieris rapae]